MAKKLLPTYSSTAQFDETIQVILRNMILQRKAIGQESLCFLL